MIYKGAITKEEFDKLINDLYKNNKKFKEVYDYLEWFDDWLSMQSPEVQREFNEAAEKMFKEK